MIITQTPYRMSFFGGGTDYPKWFKEHGGSTLVTSIDKYCYISCRALPPFFSHKHRIVYSKIETVNEISEIQHPAARAVMQFLKVNKGVEIHHDGDLPARSGIGSSSAFTVGLLRTLHAIEGELITKKKLAQQAIYVEQDLIPEVVGSQDQIAAAYGGFNKIDFFQDGNFSVSPVIMDAERRENFQNHLMLFFSGIYRSAPEIAKKQLDNMSQSTTQLKAIQAMVDEALEILSNKKTPIDEFGKMLNEGWRLKRSLAEGVSNKEIDDIYNAGLAAGAIGGKLLGAGSGGFVLFFVPPEKRVKLRETFKKLVHVAFRFENGGSKTVHYDPNF